MALSIITPETPDRNSSFHRFGIVYLCVFFSVGYSLHNLPRCQVQNKRSRCCFSDAFGLLWFCSLEFWSVARAKAEYSTPFENRIFFFLSIFSNELCFCLRWSVRMDADGWVRIIPSNTPLNCTKDSRIDYVRSIYLCFYSCCSFYWILFSPQQQICYTYRFFVFCFYYSTFSALAVISHFRINKLPE